MRATVKLVAALIISGLLLAGCGNRSQDAQGLLGMRMDAWPAGSGPVLTIGEPVAKGTVIPFKLISQSVPKQFPDPARSSLARDCTSGGIVTVTLVGGRTITYGPCHSPVAIERVRRAMLAAYRFIRRPVPGAPATTPLWLSEMVWRLAANRGDPTPERIEVSLGIADRYGRTRDRVFMRGRFSVDCSIGLGSRCDRNTPERVGQILGFTIDAKTRQVVSSSGRPG
jgi:hypothetical protein